MSPPPRTEIVDAIKERSHGRIDIDMAEKYGYHDFTYANYFERFIDCCGWVKASLTSIPRELGSEQTSLAGECLRGINREVKYYCKTTPRGVRSEARDDLFTRFAMVMNYLENTCGRRLPVE
ncbi:hypothetical protein BJX68DRAFT_268228 [Aspergillus pseudodeflectus]|uniref:Uncharacterized protein n=1 Tax=Aspergillus pseudodeflectus TaxID=176178 RepID=A0ABR4K5I8_9EURO